MPHAKPRLILVSSLMTTMLFGACTSTPDPIFRPTDRADAFRGPDMGRLDADTPERDAAEELEMDAPVTPDAGIDDLTPTAPFESPVAGVVTGVVTDARTGDPIVGARISISGASVEALTNATGAYAVDLAPGASYIIHFSREGYIASHRRLSVVGWERVAINASLLPAGPSTAVNNGTGGTITVDGTRVTIPAGSLTDGSGAPVGTGTVTVTPIDPTSDLDGAPGDFEGDPTDGMPTPIVSFGMVDIQVQTPTGPGGLGTPATIEVPVGDMPADNPELAEGECMPLWWFDPERAIWVEEGEACAMRSPTGGLVLVGNIGRPGVWNCDVPVQPVCYTGTVTDCGGIPIPGAEIRLTGGSVTSSTTTRTDFDGHFEVRGAARRGAIIRASVVIAGNTYIEESDFVDGNPATCTPAPTVAFPFRYVSGAVSGTGLELHGFSGGTDNVAVARTGGARFWDLVRGPVPYTLTCSGAPTNSFETIPSEMGTATNSIDVGNPVTLIAEGVNTDLFRTRVSMALSGYVTPVDQELPSASVFDVNIRGAAGAMPRALLPAALRMPGAAFTVTSPAEGVRSYPASLIPLRWTPAADGGEMSVMIFSVAEPSNVAYARLADDGSENISLASFPLLRGAVTIWITRSVRNYVRLPIGSAVELNGSQRVVFDATIR